MKRIAVLLFAIALAGCATIDATCPTDGSTTIIAIGGSTVGTTALAYGQAAGKAAGVMAKAGATAATTPGSCSVHYSYIPIFGSDYVQLGTQPQQPTPTIVVAAPGPPAPQILK